MAQVFFCYAREDEEPVRQVHTQLRTLGFQPWMDKVDLVPGQRWRQEIPRALRASDFILIFFSQHSVSKRGYVQREFKLALDTLEEMPETLIHTIPVRLDACEVPEAFQGLQWCDLFEPGGFEQLTRSLRLGLTQRQRPALEPQPEVQMECAVSEAPASSPADTIRPHETVPPAAFEASATTFTNTIGMTFVRIPIGNFMMGSPDSDAEAYGDEKPPHRVTISQPFYLGVHPVTQAQWEAVMGDNPSAFTGNSNRPVEQVSWHEVQTFLQKLNELEPGRNYRLPTEAQWEYACRARTETPRYHANLDAIAWYAANSNGQTHAVGQKLPNAWGLYDMLGNVWEWCHDGKRPYTAESALDPVGPTDAGALRVHRGGGWSGTAAAAEPGTRSGFPRPVGPETDSRNTPPRRSRRAAARSAR